MKDYFQSQFQYHAWAMAKTLEGLRDNPKSISIFSHIQAASKIWYNRIKGIPEEISVWPSWSMEENKIQLNLLTSLYKALGDSLSEKELERQVHYKTSTDQKHETSVKDILTHVLLHSHYHRGQIAIILEKSQETDYIYFLRSNIR